jgi:hypothetical protein
LVCRHHRQAWPQNHGICHPRPAISILTSLLVPVVLLRAPA